MTSAFASVDEEDEEEEEEEDDEEEEEEEEDDEEEDEELVCSASSILLRKLGTARTKSAKDMTVREASGYCPVRACVAGVSGAIGVAGGGLCLLAASTASSAFFLCLANR